MTFTSSSTSSEELLQIARNAIISGHRTTAARMINRVLETEPVNKEAWRLLADCMTDPDAKRKCLIKAGDLQPLLEKIGFTSERYTTTSSSKIELPPVTPESGPDPVVLPPRKYRPTPRAENPSVVVPGKTKTQILRKARTRKTDPQYKKNHKSRASCLIFVLISIALAIGFVSYLYFNPTTTTTEISNLLFPSSQSDSAGQVDGLVPPNLINNPSENLTSNENEQAVVVPDANQPQPVPVADPVIEPLVEKVLTIGQSVAGRPIEVYQFGTGETQRLIVAGMHGGNEYNTIDLADELIEYIRSHPGIIPPEKTLFILRNLNPDGEARGHDFDGRTNENGVDLNRNWDSDWKIDWPREGCWIYRPVTGGPFPASEPETKALLGFMNNNHIDALINYHSAALGIFPGGQPPDEASTRLALALHEVTGYSYPPIDTGCEFTGMFTDWASDHGIPAVDVELTNHRDTDFNQNLKALEVLLAWGPYSTPKNLPGIKPSNPAYPEVALEPKEETIVSKAKDAVTGLFNDFYGLIMSKFEER
jgi:murein peptide amidase A